MIIDHLKLLDLVRENSVVTDFIGPVCRAEKIDPAVEALLADPSAQRAAMALTMQRLGQGGEPPGLRAARSVLAALRAAPRR